MNSEIANGLIAASGLLRGATGDKKSDYLIFAQWLEDVIQNPDAPMPTGTYSRAAVKHVCGFWENPGTDDVSTINDYNAACAWLKGRSDEKKDNTVQTITSPIAQTGLTQGAVMPPPAFAITNVIENVGFNAEGDGLVSVTWDSEDGSSNAKPVRGWINWRVQGASDALSNNTPISAEQASHSAEFQVTSGVTFEYQICVVDANNVAFHNPPIPLVIPESATLAEYGTTLTGSTQSLNVIDNDPVVGARYDLLRWNDLTQDWDDLGDSIANPNLVFVDKSGFPTDGSTVRFRLNRWLNDDPSKKTFSIGEATAFKATPPVGGANDLVFTGLTRKFEIGNQSAGFVSQFGYDRYTRTDTIDVPMPDGVTINQYLLPATGSSTTVTSRAQLESVFNSAQPGDTIKISGSVTGYTLPAGKGGVPGNPVRITGTSIGANTGSGSTNNIHCSDVVFHDMNNGSVFAVTGNRNMFINNTLGAGVVVSGGTTTNTPSDNVIVNNKFANTYRSGVTIGTSAGIGTTNKHPLRTVVAFNDFDGFIVKAIASVGGIINYPVELPDTYTIIYGNTFRNCRDEIVSVKSPSWYVSENLFDCSTSSNLGHFSIRHGNRCVFVNNYILSSGPKPLILLCYEHIVANNTIISRNPRGFETELAGATSKNVPFMWHRRSALAKSIVEDNLVISHNNTPASSRVLIGYGFGPEAHQNWINLGPNNGFNVEQNTIRNNVHIGPSGAVPPYKDSTGGGLLPESTFLATNDAPKNLEKAMTQTGLTATSSSSITIRGEKTYANKWENGSDVVVRLPLQWQNGALLSVA